MKYLCTLFLITLCCVCSPVFANDYNAGFVEGLWFSSEPVFAGETVRLYVALRNNTGEDLTGRVVFYDNDERISSQAVSALDGRIIEAWTDWQPTRGTHELRAELTSVELDSIDGSDRSVTVPNSTVTESRYVDIDTDGDGIGNSDDPDDDNDGFTDEEEAENNTDPLIPNQNENTETQTNEEETDEQTNTTGRQQPQTSTDPQGIERYELWEPVDTSFTALTDTINTSKRSLDTYRENRSQAADTRPSSNNASSSASSSPAQNIIDSLAPEQAAGTFLTNTMTFLQRNISNAYDGMLWLLSKALARPLLLQIALILLSLLFIYKIARRLGARE